MMVCPSGTAWSSPRNIEMYFPISNHRHLTLQSLVSLLCSQCSVPREGKTFHGQSHNFTISLGINRLALVVSWKLTLTMPGDWISCWKDCSVPIPVPGKQKSRKIGICRAQFLSLELYPSATVQNTTRCLQSVISVLLTCSPKCRNYPDFNTQLHKVLLGNGRVFTGSCEMPRSNNQWNLSMWERMGGLSRHSSPMYWDVAE